MTAELTTTDLKMAYQPGKQDLSAFGADAFKSRLYPGIASPEAAKLIVMQGAELGLTAIRSLNGIHVIKGRPALSAELMRSLVLASGKAKLCQPRTLTSSECTFVCQRIEAAEPFVVTWTLDDAKRAKLGGDNWSKYPRAMLLARASAECIRAVFPDVIGGLHAVEELRDSAPLEVQAEVKAPPAGDTLREKLEAGIAAAGGTVGEVVDVVPEPVEAQADDAPYRFPRGPFQGGTLSDPPTEYLHEIREKTPDEHPLAELIDAEIEERRQAGGE